jgi:hypothetical protein
MMFRRIAIALGVGIGAAAGLGLAAEPAAACVGEACRGEAGAKSSSKPLDLGQFMRHGSAKTARRSESRRHTVRKPVTRRQTRTTKAPSPQPPALPVEAAAAYALQPNNALRVEASGALGDIDRTTGVAPIERDSASAAAENAVKLVDAAEFNEIDRKARDLPPATIETAVTEHAPRASGNPAGDFWLARLWTALQSGLAALAAMVRSLFG